MNVMKELFHSRSLIWKLAKNDFKTKFAGSYFGIIWAFVQPVVTVMVYFVVFQLGLRIKPAATGYPYICWLVAGIIPWFFFSDALASASNCLLEYSYLVKKVVFKISVLPIVKVVSSLFVHIFFVVFAFLVYVLMGKLPPIQIVQILYYMAALICLIISLTYLTSAIVPFFRDFGQIINVLLAIGMWATPILWDKTTISNMPGWLDKILKLNPLYYIVQGYRDSFMNGYWFFEHPLMTVYFWCFVVVMMLIGFKVFKKMRVHFSDVL